MRHGADVNWKDGQGEGLIHKIAARNSRGMMERFFEAAEGTIDVDQRKIVSANWKSPPDTYIDCVHHIYSPLMAAVAWGKNGIVDRRVPHCIPGLESLEKRLCTWQSIKEM